MLKLLAFLLALSLIASVWAVFRQRMKRAFKAVALIYAVTIVVRLFQMGIDQERVTELAIVTSAFVGFWMLMWGTITLRAKWRRDRA